MYTQYYYNGKPMSETLNDIYDHINKIENKIFENNKPADINIVANLDLKNDKAIENIHEIKEEVEELSDLLDELELPDIRPIINFYGCSFNFGEGSAEATYHMGDDNWERKVED